MKTLMTKIIGACLGVSLTTGVSVGIAAGQNRNKEVKAADEPYYTLTPAATGGNTKPHNSYADAATTTINDIRWSVTGNSSMVPWRIGGKSITDTDRTVYSMDSMEAKISRVELDLGVIAATVNSLKLEVASNSNFSTVLDTISKTSVTADSTVSFLPTTGTGWATGAYYRFTFNITVTDTSNKFIAFSAARFYEDSSAATLSSLEITGDLEKTSSIFGEAWNRRGLSLVGHFSDGSTQDLTGSADWSYSPNCANIGVTSLTVTAEFNGLSASYTTNITVSKIASPFVNGVPYKMFLHNTNKNADYYFIGAMGTGNQKYYGATTNDSSSTSIANMYFEPKDDGQALYFYAGNNTSTAKQYIYISVSGEHINFKYGTTSATWYYNGRTMVTYLASDDGIYGMGTYDNYVTFGAAASYRVSNYFAQFSLVNPLTAEDFANQFLDIVTCDSTGETAPTYKYNYSWQALNDLFDQLDATEQNTLKTVDISGTDVVAQAMARYNLIVAKYGYTNFVNRTISNVSNRIMNINSNSEVTIIVVSMIAIVMSSVLAFYFFKKKKFNR